MATKHSSSSWGNLSACPQRSRLFSRHALARTLAGNTLDLLVISDSTLDLVAGSPSHKRALVMTGRVHPGETNASFMMHGIIDFLLGPSQYAAQLRAGFVIYVVPMLNPDGVILGNYRCSLSGHDLNRAYPAPHAELHPEICAVKKLARENDDVILAHVPMKEHSMHSKHVTQSDITLNLETCKKLIEVYVKDNKCEDTFRLRDVVDLGKKSVATSPRIHDVA